MARKPSSFAAALNRPRAIAEGGDPPPPKKSKRGTFLGGYVDDATKRQFKVVLAERGITEQAALEEMLDDFFMKHGKHRIATGGRSVG